MRQRRAAELLWMLHLRVTLITGRSFGHLFHFSGVGGKQFDNIQWKPQFRSEKDYRKSKNITLINTLRRHQIFREGKRGSDE